VHCYAGVSRSSAILAAYLMWKYRWTLEKTLSFLVYKRIVAKPNDGFYNQLKEVEIKLNITNENVNKAPIQHQNNQNHKEQLNKPNSPTNEALTKRPSSTMATAIQKPQSPLQLQNFNSSTNRQFHAAQGDPYMAHLENSILVRPSTQQITSKLE
jgi:hypothetical protein